jgi:undecaprenyl-diphosphatase
VNEATHTLYPPLEKRRAAAQLVGGGLLLALGLCLIGWIIVRVAGAQSLIGWEDPVNVWLADHRTPAFDLLTHLGSSMADTIACIALLLVMVIVTRVWLGRWREPLALFAAIVGELLVFLIVTAVVQRDRPDVVRLDAAPPTSSFPSGHTAASVALYGCLAVIVNREMRTRWLALLIAAVCWAVPALVGISRMYRGMHHPTDVLFGYIGGGLWLTIVLVTLLPLAPSRDVAEQRDPPGPGSGALAHESVSDSPPLGRVR